jgi:flagellar biosynthesis protein FliR
VTPFTGDTLTTVCVLFCRIGAGLAFAPGFSSPRIPMRIRLFIALGLTTALAPLLVSRSLDRIHGWSAADLALAIGGEILLGTVFGLSGRLIVQALETMAVAMSMSIGLSSSLAPRIDEAETLPELATLVVFATTTLIFIADLHWTMIGAVLDSYRRFPIGDWISGPVALSQIVDALAYAFPLALRIAGPFLAFGAVSQLAFGLIGKASPQLPIYFISTPFILAGGLALLYAAAGGAFSTLMSGLSFWLGR